jgi:hypothetical protein
MTKYGQTDQPLSNAEQIAQRGLKIHPLYDLTPSSCCGIQKPINTQLSGVLGNIANQP